MNNIRVKLILVLGFLAGLNLVLDSWGNTPFAYVLLSACVLGTSAPPFIAYLVASKTQFSLLGKNIYKLAADSVLTIYLAIWLYLVFVRVRPDFYEGASHLYLATWPILLGLFTLLLYLACLITQGIYGVVSKHNR